MVSNEDCVNCDIYLKSLKDIYDILIHNVFNNNNNVDHTSFLNIKDTTGIQVSNGSNGPMTDNPAGIVTDTHTTLTHHLINNNILITPLPPSVIPVCDIVKAIKEQKTEDLWLDLDEMLVGGLPKDLCYENNRAYLTLHLGNIISESATLYMRLVDFNTIPVGNRLCYRIHPDININFFWNF